MSLHCVESVRIQSFSDPYSVRMRENTGQKNSEYGHFSRSFSERDSSRTITVLFISFGTFIPVSENIVDQNIFLNKISLIFDLKKYEFLIFFLRRVLLLLL